LVTSFIFIGYLSIEVLSFVVVFTVINYFLGIFLERSKDKSYRKKVFWLGIFIDIGILAFFKYINFIFENINAVLSIFPDKPHIPYLSIIIPIGISYYTFQALGYLIRINRNSEKPEKDFLKFATLLMFFPKFLSGPVERSNHFLPQLSKRIEFDSKMVTSGLQLFLWGLFKKVVIADNIVGPVMLVYNNVEEYSGIPLIVVMFLQTIHIYCDFSGYTDMALGSARIFGIKIIDNFNRPFFAKTVGELWRRWHISLSSWCNDFIFTPFIVKYRKMGNRAAIIGIFLTFFVIGIWHGANWTFVVLGILQGIAISYEFYTKRKRITIANKLPQKFVVISSRIITYVFFSFSLIFFNSLNIQDAWYFVTHMFTNIELKLTGHQLIFDKVPFLVAMIAFLFLFITEIYAENGKTVFNYFVKRPLWLRWTGYYILIFLIYYFNKAQDTFVYLQF
jgi:D-alanyl-lipoteichoic acid acyltransferase DltB (MBOAT superfamily)